MYSTALQGGPGADSDGARLAACQTMRMGGNKWFAYASLARDEINRGAVFAVVCEFSALTAMVAGLSMTARAAEPATLTLACTGTAASETEDAKPEPVSMGIIVNFTAGTVNGFTYPGADLRLTITQV